MVERHAERVELRPVPARRRAPRTSRPPLTSSTVAAILRQDPPEGGTRRTRPADRAARVGRRRRARRGASRHPTVRARVGRRRGRADGRRPRSSRTRRLRPRAPWPRTPASARRVRPRGAGRRYGAAAARWAVYARVPRPRRSPHEGADERCYSSTMTVFVGGDDLTRRAEEPGDQEHHAACEGDPRTDADHLVGRRAVHLDGEQDESDDRRPLPRASSASRNPARGPPPPPDRPRSPRTRRSTRTCSSTGSSCSRRPACRAWCPGSTCPIQERCRRSDRPLPGASARYGRRCLLRLPLVVP